MTRVYSLPCSWAVLYVAECWYFSPIMNFKIFEHYQIFVCHPARLPVTGTYVHIVPCKTTGSTPSVILKISYFCQHEPLLFLSSYLLCAITCLCSLILNDSSCFKQHKVINSTRKVYKVARWGNFISSQADICRKNHYALGTYVCRWRYFAGEGRFYNQASLWAHTVSERVLKLSLVGTTAIISCHVVYNALQPKLLNNREKLYPPSQNYVCSV